MPITVLDLAIHRGAKSDPEFSDESFSVEAIEATGFPIISGCGSCWESLGSFNGYPSKLGSIRCKDCIGQNGFETVEEANAFIFPPEDEDTFSLWLRFFLDCGCQDSGDCSCDTCNAPVCELNNCCCGNCSEYPDENDSRLD